MTKPLLRSALPLVVACLLTGCVPPPGKTQSRCTAALGPPVLVFNLFFGRNVPGLGNVTDKEWRAFLDQEVTPNLPHGYTVFDAQGAWMNPVNDKTLREPTRVLMVALPDVPESAAAVTRVRNAYQVRFRQGLVGMAVYPACGSF